MDRSRIELQIRATLVTYRIERRSRDSLTMHRFRERAQLILDQLEQEVGAHPDLQAKLLEARQELER